MTGRGITKGKARKVGKTSNLNGLYSKKDKLLPDRPCGNIE